MKQILLLPIIFALSVISCLAQSTDFQSKTTPDVVITISLQDCMCISYSARIYDNGTVVFEDGANPRKKRYQIPVQKVSELVEEFYRINYFSLKDEYRRFPLIDDGGVIVTSISVDGRKKTVRNDGGGPPELNELEKKIAETADYLKHFAIKARLDHFYAILHTNPAAIGLIINYGTAKNIGKRVNELKAAIKFRDYDQNQAKFVRHIEKRGIRTEFKITADGKTISF